MTFHVLNSHNGMKMGEAVSFAAAARLADGLCAQYQQIYQVFELNLVHTAAPPKPEAAPSHE